MKFTSGARVRFGSFTIVPSRRQVLPDQSVVWTQPLRAEFREHRFDSVQAQQRLGWTDEEREIVEKGLQKHRRFNQSGGRGIFINKLGNRPAPTSAVEADAEAANFGRKLRCLHFSEDEEGNTTQCPELADPDFPEYDLCAHHREEMLEQRGNAVPPAVEPV